MLTLQKIINVCKFLANLVVSEEEIIFECRPEFFYQKTPGDPAYSSLSYKHLEVKKIIYAFKYDKNSRAIKICADLVSKKIIELSSMKNISEAILVPIPRSKLQVQKYGFDQCNLLCQEIMKCDEIKNLNLILKFLIVLQYFLKDHQFVQVLMIFSSQKLFLLNLWP